MAIIWRTLPSHFNLHFSFCNYGLNLILLGREGTILQSLFQVFQEWSSSKSWSQKSIGTLQEPSASYCLREFWGRSAQKIIGILQENGWEDLGEKLLVAFQHKKASELCKSSLEPSPCNLLLEGERGKVGSCKEINYHCCPPNESFFSQWYWIWLWKAQNNSFSFVFCFTFHFSKTNIFSNSNNVVKLGKKTLFMMTFSAKFPSSL